MTRLLPSEYLIPKYVMMFCEGDSLLLYNSITGRYYKLSATLYRFLLGFYDVVNDKRLVDLVERELNLDMNDGSVAERIYSLLITLHQKTMIVSSDLPRLGMYDFCEQELYVPVEDGNPLFALPAKTLDLISREDIVLCGAPLGAGNANDSGAALFPSEYRNFIKSIGIGLGAKTPLSHFRFLTKKVLGLENLLVNLQLNRICDVGDVRFLRGEPISIAYAKIGHFFSLLFEKGAKPFTLGGDHSITFSIIKSLSSVYSNLQVIHFDAHMDMSPRIANDFIANRYGLPEVPDHATFMNYCLDFEAVTKVLMVGIRGCANFAPPAHSKVSMVWADEVGTEIFYEKIESLDFTAPTYVSFDIDVFDPLLAPATSVPVINGLSYSHVEHMLLEVLTRFSNVVGVDLVEVYPDLDEKSKTMQLVTHLVPLFLNLFK